jgi:hypothetical protein
MVEQEHLEEVEVEERGLSVEVEVGLIVEVKVEAWLELGPTVEVEVGLIVEVEVGLIVEVEVEAWLEVGSTVGVEVRPTVAVVGQLHMRMEDPAGDVVLCNHWWLKLWSCIC